LVSQLRVSIRVGGGRGCRIGHEDKAGRKNKKGREVKRGEAVAVRKARLRRVSPGPRDEGKAYRGKRSIQSAVSLHFDVGITGFGVARLMPIG
jgi:hypothetical protein